MAAISSSARLCVVWCGVGWVGGGGGQRHTNKLQGIYSHYQTLGCVIDKQNTWGNYNISAEKFLMCLMSAALIII